MNDRPLFLLAMTALMGLALSACSDGSKDEHHDHDHDHAHSHHDKDHDHDHAKDKHGDAEHSHAGEAGPNGGRLVTATEPHFEFLVLEDRKLQITFLSEEGEAIEAGAASVTGVGGERSQPTQFQFAAQGKSLLSDQPLPAGDMVPLVLQVKLSPDGETVTEKFTVNLNDCPTCEYKEYACICDHDHDHDHEAAGDKKP